MDIVDDLVVLFTRHLGAQQQIGGRAERGKRRAQFMDELRDQVGLLEQAGVLDGDRCLRTQHRKHRLVRIREPASFLVKHFEHTHHLVLCNERDTQQRLGRIPDRLLHLAEEAVVLVGIIDTHRLAVGHHPARNALIQRDDKAAHGRLVNVGRDLKVELAGGIVVQKDGCRFGMCDIRRGAHDIVQQGVEVQGRGQVARDFDQPQVTIKCLCFDLSHSILASRFQVIWQPRQP